MNKRIKEFAKQCSHFRSPPETWFDYEKFAEFIVRECLAQNKLAIQSLKDNPEDTPGYKTILNLAQVTCRNQIEEHFGVEE